MCATAALHPDESCVTKGRQRASEATVKGLQRSNRTVMRAIAAIPLGQVATMSWDHIIDVSNQVAIADQEMTWRTPSIS